MGALDEAKDNLADGFESAKDAAEAKAPAKKAPAKKAPAKKAAPKKKAEA